MEMQKENRTDKFIKNVLGSLFLQLVTIVTGFISPKIMLSAFGSEINGVTSSITQFISYIALVEAGLANATVFALYRPLATGDKRERDSIVSAARISYNRVGVIFVVLSLGLAAIYPLIGKTDELSSMELSVLVLVLCLNTTINFFVLAKYRSLLTADQCGYLVSVASAIQLIVNLIIILVTTKIGLGVIAVRGLAICSMFVTSITLSTIVHKKYGDIDFKAPPNMSALDTRKDAMMLQILGVVVSGAPVVIMTAILDFKQISVYAIYNMIAGSIATCLTVFTSGLSASFGNIYASNDEKLLIKTTSEFRTAFYVILAIIFTIAMITLLPFIDIYTEGITDVNYHLPLFGILIILKGLIENFRAPHGMLVQSFGKFKSVKNYTVIQMIIVLVCGGVFTKIWGLEGMMFALCITHLYMLIILLYVTPKYLVKMSVKKNIAQIIRVFLILVSEYFIALKIGYVPQNYFEWLLYACIVGMITVILVIVVFMIFDREDMISLYNRIKFRLKRR